jgi:hypothetical protein
MKIKSNTMSAIYLHATHSLTKTSFQYLHDSLLSSPIYSLSPPNKNVKLRSLNENLIICSLKKINSKGIVDTVGDFSDGEIANEFVRHGNQNVPKSKLKRWKRLFVNHDNERNFYSFLTKNHDDKTHESYYVDNRNNLRTNDKKKVGKIKKIPRNIHIFVLDGIRSVEDFASVYRDVLHSIDSKIWSTN